MQKNTFIWTKRNDEIVKYICLTFYKIIKEYLKIVYYKAINQRECRHAHTDTKIKIYIMVKNNKLGKNHLKQESR